MHRSFRFTDESEGKKSNPTSFRDLGSDLALTVVVQCILALFAGLILDGGECLAGLAFFIVVHWIVVLIVAARRFDCLTRVDVILVRMGFLLYLAGSVVVLGTIGMVVDLFG